MKKLIAILLSLTFILSVSVYAATSSNPNEQSSSKDVTATYQSSATDTPVYSVDITWGSMTFVYSVSSRTWDPETHSYNDGGGSWSCNEGANLVTIVNHSNKDVACNISFSPRSEGITGSLSEENLTLTSAVDKSLDAPAIRGSSLLTLNGALADTNESATVGTISVTISASD